MGVMRWIRVSDCESKRCVVTSRGGPGCLGMLGDASTAPCTFHCWLPFVRFGTYDGVMSEAVLAAFVRFGTHDGAKHVRSSCWFILSRLASSRGGARLGFFVLPVWAPMLCGVT